MTPEKTVEKYHYMPDRGGPKQNSQETGIQGNGGMLIGRDGTGLAVGKVRRIKGSRPYKSYCTKLRVNNQTLSGSVGPPEN